MSHRHFQPLIDLFLPALSDVNPPSYEEIQAAECEIGTAFSPQYRELIARFGAGMIDNHVILLGPNALDENIRIQERGVTECTATKSFLEKWGIPAPQALYPDGNGVFPWALTIDGDLFFMSPVIDNWVGVFPRHSNSWQTFECGVISFLIGLLTRRLEVDCIPSYFPPTTHKFEPAEKKEKKTR